MTTPTESQKQAMNLALAETQGINPKRRWRVFYDKDRQHASIDMASQEEALQRRKESADLWIGCGHTTEEFSEPEEYDEWHNVAPRYCSDLNAVHEVEKKLNAYQRHKYTILLRSDVASVDAAWTVIHADAPTRVLALLRVLKPEFEVI